MAIQAKRIRDLNNAEPDADGSYVLYLLQQANRAHFNPALELAIEEANRLGLPVVVCFGLLDGANGFPEANARHYAFLLQGLADAKAGLEARGIHFVMRKASPAEIAIDLSAKAALLVLDRGYLAIQKRWYGEIAKAATIRVVQVEGDVVVPVEVASPKHEFAARTLRPKILKLLDEYVEELKPRAVKHKAGRGLPTSEVDVSDPEAVLAGMSLDREVAPVTRFTGGETEARRRLKAYLAGPFGSYGTDRNRPEAGGRLAYEPLPAFRADLAGGDRPGGTGLEGGCVGGQGLLSRGTRGAAGARHEPCELHGALRQFRARGAGLGAQGPGRTRR